MSPETPHGPTGRPAVSREEAKAWAGFYALAARNPAFADEVIRLLDADPLLKRHHLALYLRGRACLCQHQARQARRQRQRAWLSALSRFLADHLVAGPRSALQQLGTKRRDQLPPIMPAMLLNQRATAEAAAPDLQLPSLTSVSPSTSAPAAAPGPALSQTTPLVH